MDYIYEMFDKIPVGELKRLSVGSSPLSPGRPDSNKLRILGIDWKYGDYTIIDYSYYDALKRNGLTANLSNMVALHNYLLERE